MKNDSPQPFSDLPEHLPIKEIQLKENTQVSARYMEFVFFSAGYIERYKVKKRKDLKNC